jgi:hypothetical protein
MDDILTTLAIPAAPMKVHALRSTFIRMALEDGADDRLIERITHTPGKSRRAFDRYDRADYWPSSAPRWPRSPSSRRLAGASSRWPSGLPHLLLQSAEPARVPLCCTWRRRESNPRPRMLLAELLRAYPSLVLSGPGERWMAAITSASRS